MEIDDKISQDLESFGRIEEFWIFVSKHSKIFYKMDVT